MSIASTIIGIRNSTISISTSDGIRISSSIRSSFRGCISISSRIRTSTIMIMVIISRISISISIDICSSMGISSSPSSGVLVFVFNILSELVLVLVRRVIQVSV